MARVATNWPITYAPMGDSLTVGLFASAVANNFANKLAELITAGKGHEVVLKNHGHSGACITLGVLDGTGVADYIQTVAEYPDIVTIEFGTNDAGLVTPTDEATFEADLNTIINGLQHEHTPLIVLLTTWNQYALGNPYDAIIAAVGAERGLTVIELDPISNVESNRKPGDDGPWGASDEWHPNDAGHLAIAQAIYNAIATQITAGARRRLTRATATGRVAATGRSTP